MIDVPPWVLFDCTTVWVDGNDQRWHDDCAITEVDLYTTFFVVDVVGSPGTELEFAL